MRNILALIGLAVVLVAGGGWYLGWYKLSSQPGTDGHRSINVDIDVKKIIEDEKKAQQKLTDVIAPENKGGTVVPNVPTPPAEKQVPGQTTGFQFSPNGTVIVVPPPPAFKTIE